MNPRDLGVTVVIGGNSDRLDRNSDLLDGHRGLLDGNRDHWMGIVI